MVKLLASMGAVIVIGFSSGNSVHAASIYQPVGVSTDMGSFATFEPIFTIDQSGLAAGYVSGVTDFDTFVAATNTVSGGGSFNTWFSQSGDTTGNLEFDLGGSFAVDSLALWADPQGAGQTVNNFNLLADDNALFSSPILLGNFYAVDGTSDATNFGQIFAFSTVVASHFRIEILSNHGSTLTTGLVEVAFEASPVPVPGIVWAFVSALGLLYSAKRNRL